MNNDFKKDISDIKKYLKFKDLLTSQMFFERAINFRQSVEKEIDRLDDKESNEYSDSRYVLTFACIMYKIYMESIIGDHIEDAQEVKDYLKEKAYDGKCYYLDEDGHEQ